MKIAEGTSLRFIDFNSLTGFAGYLGQVQIDWGFVAAFTLNSAVCIVAGSWLVNLFLQALLKRSFAI